LARFAALRQCRFGSQTNGAVMRCMQATAKRCRTVTFARDFTVRGEGYVSTGFLKTTLGATLVVALSASGAIAGSSMFRPPMPITNPERHGDRSAVTGDRHDVDPGFPGQAGTTPHMSAAVSFALREALFAVHRKDWETAKAKLREARAAANASDFDRFEIEVAASYLALNTGDRRDALDSYKKVIASAFFKTQTALERSATLRNAMILSNEVHDFPGAVSLGTRLASEGPLDETAAIALATAYFGDKNYAAAQTLAQRTLDAEVAAGMATNTSAMQIVAQSETSLHYAAADTPSVNSSQPASRNVATLR
jgi:hypothetical protein